MKGIKQNTFRSKHKCIQLYFIGMLVVISSCQTIAKKMYGIKKPKEETVTSIETYMHSIQLSVDNNLFIKNYNNYTVVLKQFGNSLPEAILFDKNGNRMQYKKEQQDCNAGLFETIPNLTEQTNTLIKDTGNMYTFLQLLIDRNGNSIKQTPQADFYLFINWAKYMGKLNKDHVMVWEELAAKNKKARIVVYKINMDIQKSWDARLNK